MSDHTLTFAIVTCSDTRSMKEDTAGAALETLIAEKGWDVREPCGGERRACGHSGCHRQGGATSWMPISC